MADIYAMGSNHHEMEFVSIGAIRGRISNRVMFEGTISPDEAIALIVAIARFAGVEISRRITVQEDL